MILFVFLHENLKIVQAQIKFIVVWLDFCDVHFIYFGKRQASATIEQQKCKGYEKRDQILSSKVEFNFQVSQRSKNVTYWANFLKLA